MGGDQRHRAWRSAQRPFERVRRQQPERRVDGRARHAVFVVMDLARVDGGTQPDAPPAAGVLIVPGKHGGQFPP
jgi:hypothetical protein